MLKGSMNLINNYNNKKIKLQNMKIIKFYYNKNYKNVMIKIQIIKMIKIINTVKLHATLTTKTYNINYNIINNKLI